MINSFFLNQFKEINKHLINIEKSKLDLVSNLIIKTNKKKKNIFVVGNGGSAATASHFSSDLSINAKIKTINFNEYNLITALSNDFGYEKWVEKSLEIYAKNGDLLILISCSGDSPNLVYANKIAIKKKIKVITLTGCSKTNKLNSNPSNTKIWINSKKYNVIEIVHHTILLTIIDNIINKSI